MLGIDLNQHIEYKFASFRFFNENESHINRFCEDDVLLLVFDGVLRFSEDGQDYEVPAGTYHIQKHKSIQKGTVYSDAPKYLYIHFYAQWIDADTTLTHQGEFDCRRMMPLLEKLDALSHKNATRTEQCAVFYEILSRLYEKKEPLTVAGQIAVFIEQTLHEPLTLSALTQKFNYSKNHIINIFKEEYNMTPIAYANNLRIRKAQWLLSVTSQPLESIALTCGFRHYSHFYKLFLAHTGVSPTAWREMNRY